MAKFLESGLWATIRKAIPLVPGITYAERVEIRAGGFPDVLFNSVPGGAFLVELKLAEVQVSGKVKMDFRKDQPLWHYRWCKASGRSYVIAKLASPVAYCVFWGADAEKMKKALPRAEFDDLALLQSGSITDILNFILLHTRHAP